MVAIYFKNNRHKIQNFVKDVVIQQIVITCMRAGKYSA